MGRRCWWLGVWWGGRCFVMWFRLRCPCCPARLSWFGILRSILGFLLLPLLPPPLPLPLPQHPPGLQSALRHECASERFLPMAPVIGSLNRFHRVLSFASWFLLWCGWLRLSGKPHVVTRLSKRGGRRTFWRAWVVLALCVRWGYGWIEVRCEFWSEVVMQVDEDEMCDAKIVGMLYWWLSWYGKRWCWQS